MCIRVFAIVFVLASVGAMRVQPSRVALKKETVVAPDENPIDVTSLVETDAFKKSGYSCCCDKRKAGEDGINNDDYRGINRTTRANYCAIAYTWPLGKCGLLTVKVTPDTKMTHNYKKTGGTCEIMRNSIPTLVAALKKKDYCPEKEYGFKYTEGKNIYVNIPAAALGGISKAPCLDGGYNGKVTCQVGTPTVGYWGAVVCDGKPKWCPATVKSNDGAPGLSAKMFGEEQNVNCNQKTPSASTTKCTERGWIPQGDADSLPPVCLAKVKVD